MREFELPDVGEGVAEGEIVSWLVAVGDTVSEDQPVAEVETDKAVVEVPSPVDGSIAEIHAAAGDVVPVGDVIVTFAVDDEDDARTATPDRDDHPDPADTTDEAEPAIDAEPAGNGSTANDSTTGNGRVFAAPSARRLARELGVDIGAIDGSGLGGRVGTGDVRTAAESEPVAAETPASTANVTDPIGSSNDDSDDPPVEPTGDAETTEPANRTRTLAAPATRRVARELGITLDRVPASEQRNGEAFVTRRAVEGYARRQQAQDAEGQATATESDIQSGVSAGGEQRVDYRGLRRTIGQAMERSAYTAPHVSHHDTVDASALVETRDRLKPVAAERGLSLTYLPFIAKACVAALREFPSLNSSLDEEREEIVLKEYYNVGIAVGTDAGLMVPVIDDVDRKGLLRIASETTELIEQARDRSIAREAMQGGTFTITNFGAVGGEYATPIINHPETAILGLGELTERPVAIDGEVVARPTLPLSLSIDHRVIDGATAARFANRLQEFLAEPRLLLLE